MTQVLKIVMSDKDYQSEHHTDGLSEKETVCTKLDQTDTISQELSRKIYSATRNKVLHYILPYWLYNEMLNIFELQRQVSRQASTAFKKRHWVI